MWAVDGIVEEEELGGGQVAEAICLSRWLRRRQHVVDGGVWKDGADGRRTSVACTRAGHQAFGTRQGSFGACMFRHWWMPCLRLSDGWKVDNRAAEVVMGR